MNKVFENIYTLSPVPLQNLIISTYGLMEYNWRYLGGHNKYLKELRLSAKNSAEQSNALQILKLRETLAHAYAEVPHYRNLFNSLSMKPEDIKSIEDLSHIPILEKETLRNDPKGLCAESMIGKRPLVFHTSGTTGKSLTIYCDVESRRHHYAFWSRLREWQGLAKNDRRATLFGRIICDANSEQPPFWRYDAVGRNLLMSSYHLSPKNIPYYLRKLESYNPAEIIGYTSSLTLLAEQVVLEKRSNLHPRVVISTAETLNEYQRGIIEKAFRCPVIDQYGSAEMVIFVAQCKNGKHHVHVEHGLLEVVGEDGKNVECGEIGEAVCTGFVNKMMPLIRYRLGDMVRLSKETCSCGYETPILQEICGRTDDLLKTPDGRSIGRLSPIWKVVEGIKQTQVIQKTTDSLDVRIVLDKRIKNTAECKNQIEAELRKRVGNKMKIDITFVGSIPKEANAKVRAVISYLK